MRVITANSRFNPGRMMVTPNAKESLPHSEVNEAINRHLRGDWGDVCKSDGKLNDDALKNGGRLLSVCHEARRLGQFAVPVFRTPLTPNCVCIFC